MTKQASNKIRAEQHDPSKVPLTRLFVRWTDEHYVEAHNLKRVYYSKDWSNPTSELDATMDRGLLGFVNRILFRPDGRHENQWLYAKVFDNRASSDAPPIGAFVPTQREMLTMQDFALHGGLSSPVDAPSVLLMKIEFDTNSTYKFMQAHKLNPKGYKVKILYSNGLNYQTGEISAGYAALNLVQEQSVRFLTDFAQKTGFSLTVKSVTLMSPKYEFVACVSSDFNHILSLSKGLNPLTKSQIIEAFQ